MRGLLVVLVMLAVAAGAARTVAQSASGEQYAGTWLGTWDGSGEGRFDLTLEKGKEGGITGKVAVTTDAGNYTAALRSIAFDGNKMTALYDFPLDTTAEIALTATFEDRSATGTWTLRQTSQGVAVAGGGWTVSRK